MFVPLVAFFLLNAFTSTTSTDGCECPVGENPTKVLGNGLCNDKNKDGTAECQAHCAQQFKTEACSSKCVNVQGSDKAECVCVLKCATATTWGDPHFVSFDSTYFGWQGMCKYLVVKPCSTPASLPDFQINQQNIKWNGLTSPYSIVDKVELLVPEWKQTIEISGGTDSATTLTVNGQPQPIPYLYSDINKYAQRYINITGDTTAFKTITIETSFGVKVVKMGYYVYQYIPRHPELKGNTCGMLGKWDDNPSNDATDANGKLQTLDGLYSPAYGDSWCLNAAEKTSPENQKALKKQSDDVLKACDSKGRKTGIRSKCNQLLNSPQFASCAHAKRLKKAVEDCVVDMCMTKPADENAYTCTMINHLNSVCKTTVSCAI